MSRYSPVLCEHVSVESDELALSALWSRASPLCFFPLFLAQLLRFSLRSATRPSMRRVIIARAMRFRGFALSPTHAHARTPGNAVQQRSRAPSPRSLFHLQAQGWTQITLLPQPPPPLQLREATGNPYHPSIPGPLSYETDYREPERLANWRKPPPPPEESGYDENSHGAARERLLW